MFGVGNYFSNSLMINKVKVGGVRYVLLRFTKQK